MENTEEKKCLCALNKIFGFKPKTGLALISHLGSATEVFRLGRKEIEALLGPYSGYPAQMNPAAPETAGKELEKLQKDNISFIGYTEEGYPPLLRECEDAPIGLYIRSSTPVSKLWEPCRKIAVVGTRDISPYGREWCEKIVGQLATSQSRPMIISGLALGIDICAHKAAIEHNLPTVAVMATGPESIYPSRHRDFAERLCRTPGCALVTDYPPGTPPLAVHFLRRNRIIAGMSDTTILVESKMKGGGMNTSRLAFSYNREVYALPGRIDETGSQGCNHLIKSKIAEPITSLQEMMESLRMKTCNKPSGMTVTRLAEQIFASRMNAGELTLLTAVLAMIEKERGITLEELVGKSGLGYSKISSIVGILETEGLINVDLLQRCCINARQIQ